MRRLSRVALLMLFTSCSAFAQPYAEKVEITASTTPMGQMMIKGATVPDASIVGIPAYPGALVFQTMAAGAMKMNGQAGLPYIKLLSADDIEKVVAWYKKKLPTYFYQKQGFMGIYSYQFWEKKGNYGMFDMSARSQNVNVGISDGAQHRDDYPKSKTMIEITYKAAK